MSSPPTLEDAHVELWPSSTMGQEEFRHMDALVTQSEDVAWGATVIAGTRVPVGTLFDYIERGRTLDEFLAQFPTVGRKKAVAILEMARERIAMQAASG